ncbi:hypothetical protein KJ765_02795 [Candidatus Micrarchaeota archaeon]|nr:hypothetical protein [Candidatus Micrarchaeota archaeon]
MSAWNYVKPTMFRLLLVLALFIMANIPYIGTIVNGESKCLEVQCDPLDAHCRSDRQCLTYYEARPSGVFWWPYPEFTLTYSEVQVSADTIPIIAMTRNQSELLNEPALATTFAYWYLIALIITIPGANDARKRNQV